MTFAPVTFTRIDANRYIVGRVHLVRRHQLQDGDSVEFWGAYPDNQQEERPLFTCSTLEEILNMAHGACEMMRPAAGRCRHHRPEGDCPECVDEQTWDLYK